MEQFLRQLIGALEVTAGFNWRLAIGLTVVTFLGEMLIQVPFLLESVWLIIGYQVGTTTSFTIVANVIFLFLFAQIGRQLMTLAMYFLFPYISIPLFKLYHKLGGLNRFFQRVTGRVSRSHYFNEQGFLSVGSSTFAMFTPLNVPVRLLLIARRKLQTLLLATILSSVIFDGFYIILGALFHTTSLNLVYLPLFLFLGYIIFTLIRIRLARRS